MKIEKYEITLKMAGSMLVGSGFGFGRVADKTPVRDVDGIAIIPGSTVKGRLRYHCKRICLSLGEHLGKLLPQGETAVEKPVCQAQGEWDTPAALCKDSLNLCIICRIFGSPLFPSPYRFSDLQPEQRDSILAQKSLPALSFTADSELMTRVRKNRYTQTAENNALYCYEQVKSKDILYTGTINGPTLTPLELKLIEAGLKVMTHLGGGRSKGLGRITTATITHYTGPSDGGQIHE